MRVPLLVGNWKLHGTPSSVHKLLDRLVHLKKRLTHTSAIAPQMVILPPAIFIPQVAEHLHATSIAWGGQNMAAYKEGAYTGEISGSMLSAFKAQYVLLGHSERRQYHGETDEQIIQKLLLTKETGLTPILCFGETLQQYQAGQTESIILQQCKHYLTLEPALLKNIVFAYEPIWAIGTGYSLAPEQVQIIHQRLRQTIAGHFGAHLAHQIRILYGGSIQPDNAKTLFAMPDIDGGLVGKASLSADTFLLIYQAFQ